MGDRLSWRSIAKTGVVPFIHVLRSYRRHALGDLAACQAAVTNAFPSAVGGLVDEVRGVWVVGEDICVAEAVKTHEQGWALRIMQEEAPSPLGLQVH